MLKKLMLKMRLWLTNREIEKLVKDEPDYPCYNCGNPAPPKTICFKCGLESQFEKNNPL